MLEVYYILEIIF